MSYTLLVEVKARILVIYETIEGLKPFKNWISSIKDKVASARINARLNRVQHGNLGDTKSVGEGVHELRLTFGSGYRIYFGIDGDKIIVLLSAGDKSTQEIDIKLAQKYLDDYFRRVSNDKV